MHDLDKTIIPLGEAHEILSAFGIGPQSSGYQRWRRDDGFRQVDLEDVLAESSSALRVDWRDSLEETVETIAEQLSEFELDAEPDLDEEGEQGTLRIGGKIAHVKYVPEDEDIFDDVIAGINRLIASKARYRKFRNSEGTDGWAYGLLSHQDWQALQSAAGSSVALLFMDVGVA
jgi:hypothetical protein